MLLLFSNMIAECDHLFGKDLLIRSAVCVFVYVYQFLCVLLSLLVLRVGCDCISSWPLPIFLLRN